MRLPTLLLLALWLNAGEAEQPAEVGRWIPTEAVLTAYCPCAKCCGERAVGLTADGTDVRYAPYGVAADPRRLPYGTTVFIPIGHGYLDKQNTTEAQRQFTVDDTGGIIRRRTRSTGVLHLDLRFIHHRNAVKFGVRQATVYIWNQEPCATSTHSESLKP